MNKKGLEASYMVSYQVARTGKPHTIMEDLILPAAADMAGTMLGGKAKKTIQVIPSSSNTVSQCISDMAGDVLKQLLLPYKPVNFRRYSWMSHTWHSSRYMSITFMGVN